MAGNTALISKINASAPAIAFRGPRLMEETKIPAASEKNSALVNTRLMRQNSSIDTPPNSNGIASTGRIAISP